MKPSARVARNRRRALLYTPLLILGAIAYLASFPLLNSGFIAGVTLLIAGAAGFILETGQDND